MPYKIVQTKEAGRDLLSIVPSAWVSNGFVKWPDTKCDSNAKKEYRKRLMDGNSLPHEDWIEVKCRFKRELETYELAKKEWNSMSDKSDTSDASDFMPPPETNNLPIKRPVKNREFIGRAPETDYYTQVVRVSDFQF